MKIRPRSLSFSIVAIIGLITACNPGTQNKVIFNPSVPSQLSFSNSYISDTIINGKVNFPSSEFSIKVSQNDLAFAATVSLLYPPDHPTNPNVTIATGLTNISGQFSINPSASFVPIVNDVYIIEASKRIGGPGNSGMSLRTYVKWTGSSWDSITTPGLYINTKTTALVVISGFEPLSISPLGTIKKLPVVNGVTQVQDINTNIPGTKISFVSDLVTQVLYVNYDPMHYIKFVNGQYDIVNPPDLFKSPLGMISVQGGVFTMGNTLGGGDDNELPTHQATLSSYYIGRYEVTQKEYHTLVGSNPSNTFYGFGDNYPVNNVSWFDAIKYCNLKSQADGFPVAYRITGTDCNLSSTSCTVDLIDSSGNVATDLIQVKGYRLPTEAEWEYASKGGNKTSFCEATNPGQKCKYSGSNSAEDVGWYFNNSSLTSHVVGTKSPNELGIYDMSGNLFEWNQDWYAYYPNYAVNNPIGATTGTGRIVRGGFWSSIDNLLRSSFRNSAAPNITEYDIGFRIVRTAM